MAWGPKRPRAPKKAPAPLATLPGLPHSFDPPSGYKGGRHAKLPPGVMNKTERERYEELLELKRAGKICGVWFQPMRLRLVEDNGYYAVDFMIAYPDGRLELEETKGHMEAAALLRIKMAATVFPWPLTVLRKRTKKEQRENGGEVWDRWVVKGWREEGTEDPPWLKVAESDASPPESDEVLFRVSGYVSDDNLLGRGDWGALVRYGTKIHNESGVHVGMVVSFDANSGAVEGTILKRFKTPGAKFNLAGQGDSILRLRIDSVSTMPESDEGGMF